MSLLEEVDGTMAKGVRLDGCVMVPNLGYKKDTFLELSLVSNFLSNIPITTLPIHNNYGQLSQ